MAKKRLVEMTLEEKVDEILKYQKSLRFWSIIKACTNVTLFALLVILPILGIAYFFDWAQSSLGLDVSQFKQAWEAFRNLNENTGSLPKDASGWMNMLKPSS